MQWNCYLCGTNTNSGFQICNVCRQTKVLETQFWLSRRMAKKNNVHSDIDVQNTSSNETFELVKYFTWIIFFFCLFLFFTKFR